jgi:hypothetical protein
MGLKLASKYVHCSFIKLHEMHWRFNNPSVEALEKKMKVQMKLFQTLECAASPLKYSVTSAEKLQQVLYSSLLEIMSHPPHTKEISVNVKTHTLFFYVTK